MTLPVGREKVQVGADREIKVPLNVRGQGFAGLVRKKKPLLGACATQGDCKSYLLPMKDGSGYCAFFFEGDAAPINLGPRTKAIREKFAASIKDIEREERANGMHAVSVQLSKDKMLETIKQILLIFAILTAAVVALSIVIYWFV